jgi:hypothetical protein
MPVLIWDNSLSITFQSWEGICSWAIEYVPLSYMYENASIVGPDLANKVLFPGFQIIIFFCFFPYRESTKDQDLS